MPSRTLVLTPGDPAGVGPDILLTLCQLQGPWNDHILIAPYQPSLLEARAKDLGLTINFNLIDSIEEAVSNSQHTLNIFPIEGPEKIQPGKPDVTARGMVLKSLSLSAEWCLKGKADAVVTCPIAKHVLATSDAPFSGHTEFYAESAGVDQVVMLLATDGLKVALATTHLPLKDVPDAITRPLLKDVLTIMSQSMSQNWGCSNPRIKVTGLNPHAGENGTMGMEEIETIEPAIREMQAFNPNISGPYSADTLFVANHLEDCDAVLAMFHDQGLPVLKREGFKRALNITLGLPFLRTSVDHGTAFALAGTGQADASSLCYAVEETLKLIEMRHAA